MPDLDLSTPLDHLNASYKTYGLDDLESAKHTLGADDSVWFGIDGFDEPDEIGEDEREVLKFLKKFRKVIESQEPAQAIEKRLGALIAKNREHFEEAGGDSDHPPSLARIAARWRPGLEKNR